MMDTTVTLAGEAAGAHPNAITYEDCHARVCVDGLLVVRRLSGDVVKTYNKGEWKEVTVTAS